ncbi:dynamin-related protein 5A isoform X2 [Jatropha curcas]|uniref:dynamin-related protein 5A isoform X2 n=1 Tax=Jatropha curcas TaxID=180498 RepID=UPI0005FB4C47|nr:dynamin-related protein 5A isoform X2 [Jatropha curcas]
MATANGYLTTPTKTPSSTSSSKKHQQTPNSTTSSTSRFEAYNRLQAAAVAFGEKLPIPEIVALGGQSDGKSSLLEALLGFRFNVREVEMGTRRPLILQMVHDPTALEPRCRFQEEDSEEYGSPVVSASTIADIIKSRTESLLKRTKAAVSPKPIVMRAEFAHCPNLTIIDTPGFVLKAKKGEPEKTPEEILSMVKSLASPPHRILLFLQQSSVEWCSSLWLDAIREIDPTFRRTIIVVSKFDNRLKGALIDGAADPAPEQWGKTTEEEQSESSIGSWPGVIVHIKPPNATLRLYGGAAFERVIHEFRCAAYSIECPTISREKVANILLAHAGRGGGRGVTEAAAEIARAAARSWLAPLLDTACDRLAFVLGNLFDLALERNRIRDSEHAKKNGNMDGYVGFHATLRHAYNRFIKDLAKQCKQLARHHLDSVTSPYSQVCYENDIQGGFGMSTASIFKFNQASAGSFCFELSDARESSHDEAMREQENMPPEKNAQQQTTPGKGTGAREALKECQMTVPETPSPDQPCDVVYGGAKKELGNCIEAGPRKRISRMTGNNRNTEHLRVQNGGGLLFGSGDSDSRSCSAYSEICSSAAQHFARIREVLVERSVMSTLNSGFLTPCRDRLVVALGLDLFAISDEKFMDMFVAPDAIDVLQNERQSLQKRQKILQSCLNEFKNIARAL